MKKKYKIAKYWFDDVNQANKMISKLKESDIPKGVISARFEETPVEIDNNGNVIKEAVFKEGLMVDVIYNGRTEPKYMSKYRIDLNVEGRIKVDGLSYLKNKY